MKINVKSILCVVLTLNIVGCSFAAGSMQNITIIPSEEEATVFVDGSFVGTGTCTVDLKKKKSHSVMAKAEDGRVGVARIDKSVSTAGILDIVGGFFILIPWIGLAAPGFWELDPDTVAIALPPRSQ